MTPTAAPSPPPLSRRARALLAGLLLGAHLAGYLALALVRRAGGAGLPWLLAGFDPLEGLNLLLLAANIILAWALVAGRVEPALAGGAMFLLAAHTFVGNRLAPDHLTSGAMLLVNVLVLYVGVRVWERLPARHWYAFVASYLGLFLVFIRIPGLPLFRGVSNAEPLFLLFLLGLCACARSLRLLAYFWALTLSFTFLQPYSWAATGLLFLALAALFGARPVGAGRSPAALAFLGVGLALALFVLLPVVLMMTGEDALNFEALLRDGQVRAALATTAWTATVSTAFLVLLAVPLAYALSRLRFPGRALILALIEVPVVVPQSVAGIALLKVFGERQPLGEAVEAALGWRFAGTALGICLAQVFVAMPFVTKAAIAAFEAVPEDLELSARALGASSWSAFRRVALPLASRGIFMGAVLSWARAAGEFGALLFIAQTPVTAPVLAWDWFGRKGLADTGPLVAMLLLFSLVMFFLLQLVTRTLPRPAGASGEVRR